MFHSFQHILYLSCKFSHFWNIFFWCVTPWNSSVSPKIINTINHNSKNENRKNWFIIRFCTVGIIHVNMALLRHAGREVICISLARKHPIRGPTLNCRIYQNFFFLLLNLLQVELSLHLSYDNYLLGFFQLRSSALFAAIGPQNGGRFHVHIYSLIF